ncbi:uncharacterized protein BX664DRAFT_267192 [Halteromyces radiatus]|uniref:uncharacterized protein n=1 Tax=Halteromyces radiatus TaxID=101107 RepID=UPI00222021A5|nr:uncharacterized protein BX664DRAFT_267192 [Halteromyces radiatus]KAI8084650.1 hypothetical protein BX664DRAFT_267192 [Halteromyces radiatus]
MDSRLDQSRQELDLARCRSQWSNVPNLAYRFKKYNPDDEVLQETACLEAQLIELITKVRTQYYLERNGITTLNKNQTIQDTIYDQDTPQHVSLPIRLSPIQMIPIQHELERIFSRIILARVFYESGQYEKALDLLQNLVLRLEDVSAGYGFVLLIQARVIKGICFELIGKEKDALDTFEAIWTTLEEHLNETGSALAYWTEDGFYRAIMLCLRTSASVDLTLKFLRAYSQLSSSHWSSHWRNQKKWVIFKLYTDYLINVYVEGTYPVHSKITEFVNIMFKAHDIIGWGEISHIRRIQQFLYHAESLTFNSPCIFRSLFYALLRLGNFEEAKYAFRTYMELVGLPDMKINKNEIEMQGESLTTKVEMIRSKLKRMAMENDKNFNQDQPVQAETIINVIKVLLAATQLWGREYNQGKQASTIADLAVALADVLDDEEDSMDDSVVTECHRFRGVSYGLLACQSDDPDSRSEYHQEALMSLEIAVTLNPDCWKSQYELGFQQFQIRDIQAASRSITRALQINQSYLPSWHLLALLYSSMDRLISISAGLPVMSWTEEKNCRDILDLAESIIYIHLSQLACMAKMDGPETVLPELSHLFKLYRTMTAHLGITEIMELDQVSLFTEAPSTNVPLQRNDRKTSRPEIKSITTINTPVNTSSTTRPPSSSIDDLDEPNTPSLSHTTSNGVDNTETPDFAHQSEFSLASLLTPSLSMASMRSYTTNRSSSYISVFGTEQSQQPVNSFLYRQRDRWNALLMRLWLFATDLFLQAGQLDEANKAMMEMETLASGEADTWHQMGVICMQAMMDDKKKRNLMALEAFQKALTLDEDHVATHVSMAALFIQLEEWEMAESLLERTTRSFGWDHAQAWYLLGCVHQRQTHLLDKAKTCYLYALELKDTEPIQSILTSLPRFV